MKLTKEEVLHIARLARLGMTEAEVDKLSEQLSNILENFEILQQVDTTDILTTAQSITLQNVVSEDEIAPSLPSSEVLANAPQKDGRRLKIPKMRARPIRVRPRTLRASAMLIKTLLFPIA